MPPFKSINMPPFEPLVSELGEVPEQGRRRFHAINNVFTHMFLRIDRIEQWAISMGDEGHELHTAIAEAKGAAQAAMAAIATGDKDLLERITTVDKDSIERANEVERTISRRTIGFLISLFLVIVPILVGMLYKILDLITLLGRPTP